MLMVDIEATMVSLVTLTHWETTFSKFDGGEQGLCDGRALKAGVDILPHVRSKNMEGYREHRDGRKRS